MTQSLSLIAACGLCLAGCASALGDTDTIDAGLSGADAGTPASCGDEVVDSDEACDDGNLLDGDGCDPTCRVELGWRCEGQPSVCVNLCGNGELDDGEECDGADLGGHTCQTVAGAFTSGTLACSPQCVFDTTGCVQPGCGNQTVEGTEECDDGNTSNQDACLNNCREASCGDGYRWLGEEECDDGGTSNNDGCTSSCDLEYCGDGVVQDGIGEECEGGVRSCGTTCGATGQQSCQASCKWGLCVAPEETCNAADDDCDGTVDMLACLSTAYRFYNPSTGDHMYKVNDTTPDPGYVSEVGNHWSVYSSQVPGTSPVYQMFNGTDHMLSSSSTEGEQVGYWLQATIGYRAGPDAWTAAGLAPSIICRYYNPTSGDHFVYLETEIAGYVKEACFASVWDFH